MEWGLTKGLAVDLGYDKRIEDAKYFEQQQKQKEAMDIAKAKMFADDIEFVNGSNAYDDAKIKDYTRAKLGELASLANSPQGKSMDINTLIRIKEIKNDIKGNEHVLRSIAYKDAKQQHAKILEEAASNKGSYDDEDLKAINKQFEDYSKKDAAEQQGAFVYSPPTKMWDLNEVYRKMGDSYEPDEKVDVHNGRLGAYVMKPSERGLEEKARMAYERNPEQFRKYVRAGLDPVQAIKSEFRGFVKLKHFEGYDDDLGKAMKLEGYKAMLKRQGEMLKNNQGDHIYDLEVVGTKNRPIDPDTFSATFTSNPKVTYVGANGHTETEDGARFYAEQMVDSNPNKKDGMKTVYGHVIKPIDFGLANGTVEKTGIGGTGFWKDSDKPYKVKPEYAHAYKIVYPEPNSKGDGEPYLEVKGKTQVNAISQEAKARYNSHIKLTNNMRNDQAGQPTAEESGSEYPVGTIIEGTNYNLRVLPNGKMEKVNK